MVLTVPAGIKQLRLEKARFRFRKSSRNFLAVLYATEALGLQCLSWSFRSNQYRDIHASASSTPRMLKTLFRHSSIYLIGDLVRRSISLFLLPFYTRYLTPADYGWLELLDLVITVTVLLFGLSAAGEAMSRLYYEREDEHQRSVVVSTVLWIVLLIGAVTSLLGLFIAGPLSIAFFHGAGIGVIQLAFCAMLFGSLCEVLMQYQRLKRRPIVFVCCSVLQTLATIGLNVYFIAYRHWGVLGFILSKCIVLSVTSSVLLILAVREVSWRFQWRTAREIVGFGSPLIIGGLATFTIHFADRFFINRYAGLRDLGIYALAYKIGMLVSVLIGAPFSAVWNVTCYAELANPAWRTQFARAFTYLTVVAAFAAVVLSAFARPVLHTFVTPAYFAAIALVPIIAAAYSIRTLADFFPNILLINKRSGLVSGVCAVSALVNLGFNALLIPRFGIEGAAWATFATWSVYFALCLRVAHGKCPLPIPRRTIVCVGCIAAALVLVTSFVSMASLTAQWCMAALVCMVFSGAILFGGGVSRSDRERLLQYATSFEQGFISSFRASLVRAR
jgi:O-antigen/teichoic acid export membrane protein